MYLVLISIHWRKSRKLGRMEAD